jgi:CDP-diacylglycerol--serine O-phosphatidyltransferase
MVSTTVLFLHPWKLISSTASTLPLVLATYGLGFLMVSTVPYYSFKDVEVVRGRVLPILFFIIVFLTIVAINPGLMLFLLMLIYLISGPTVFLWRRYRKAEAAPGQRQVAESSTEESESASGHEEDR